MKKYLAGAVLSLSILVSPAFTHAAGLSNEQVQAILSLLSSFGADSTVIASVNTALTGSGSTSGSTSSTSTSSAAYCHKFNSDLTFGSNVNEANSLQEALVRENVLSSSKDGFTEEVAAAVVKFQAKYGIRQTGYVGPLTRAKLNSLYGCSTTVTTPTQTYSYSFEKTAALIGKMIVDLVPDDLAYDINKDGRIDLSDQLKYLNTTSIPSALVNEDKAYLVGLMLVDLIPDDLKYDINGDGVITLLDETAYAGTVTPTMTVVSPNGGQTYPLESDMKVTWSATNIPTGGYIVAQLVGEGREVTLGLTYQQTNTDNYYISAKNSIVPGKYKVRISIAGVKDGEGATDSSDGYITITGPAPTATIDQSSLTATSGLPTITGTATGFTSVTVAISVEVGSGGANIGSVPVVNGHWSATLTPSNIYYNNTGLRDNQLPVGSYRVNIYDGATGGPGYYAQGTLTITSPVTTSAPTASVTSSLTIPANTPIVFSGTATPAGSSVYLAVGSLTGTALVSSSGTWSVDFSAVRPTGFSAGSYPFTVRAYPQAGTVGNVLTSGTLTVTASVTAPTTTTTTTVAPNKNPMNCASPSKTGLTTGALACYGVWDFGSAFGDDKNLCPGYSTPAIGCKVLTNACTSGQAVATRILDTYLPWNTNKSILASATDLQQIATNLQTSVAEVQKDLIRVWEYTCVTTQAASALSGFEDASRPAATSPSVSTDVLIYTWNDDLQVGSPYFADVTALQRALVRAGVYGGEVTGGFYGQTYAAVQAFQRKYGIDATGFVGPVTRTKLNELY